MTAARALGKVFGYGHADLMSDPELAAGLVLLAQGCKGASKTGAIIEGVVRALFKVK